MRRDHKTSMHHQAHPLAARTLSGIALWILSSCCASGSNKACRVPDSVPSFPWKVDTASPEFEARAQWFQCNPDPDPATNMPSRLIDIHTHTFNANYLPLPEIVEARLPGRMTRIIGKSIVRILQLCTTPPYDREGEEKANELSSESFLTTLERILGEGPSTNKESEQQDLVAVRDYILGTADAAKSTEKIDAVMTWEALNQRDDFLEGIAYLRSVGRSLAQDPAQAQKEIKARGGWMDSLLAVIPFLGALGTRDRDMPARYRKQFGLKDRGISKVLMVTQQGSFGEAYGGKGTDRSARWPRTRRYRDYRSVLMPATTALQELPDQDILFFAAYDPFLDGSSGLELAYDAITVHGAFGFKFYPPSGSSAIANPDPVKPSADHKLHAWRSRYVEDCKTLTGAEIDQRIARFLDWSIASSVPVFTHSNPREFEADRCYGYEFTHPVYWKQFLESSQERGKLRLCIGHAGGPDFWFGTVDEDRPTLAWGKIVAYLAMKFPNVYLEVGIHDQVEDPKKRAHFQALLETLEEIRKKEGLPYSISSKILYGSDWFMPIEVSPKTYLDSYVSTFAELDARGTAGKRWSDGFFRANALRFLDAAERLTHGIPITGISGARPAKRVKLPQSVSEDLRELSLPIVQ